MVSFIVTPMARVKETVKTVQEQVLEFGLLQIILCNHHLAFFLNLIINYLYFLNRNVSEPVVGPPTNNVAEIQAATKAIRVAQECGKASK